MLLLECGQNREDTVSKFLKVFGQRRTERDLIGRVVEHLIVAFFVSRNGWWLYLFREVQDGLDVA